jgi:hypothetical protein
MNGQKDTTINSPALKNAGKPGNARAVDAEEAATLFGRLNKNIKYFHTHV